MYTEIIYFIVATTCVALGQHAPVAQFPAGVNPALCPAYPNCDNAYLHNPQQQQQPQWNAPQQNWNQQGQWNAPQQQAQQQQQNWNQEDDGQWRDDQQHNNDWSQWDQPQQQQQQQQWNAPQPQWNAAPQNAWNAPALTGPASNQLPAADKFPAGVNPQSCPNYPYCDNANLAGGHHGAAQVAPLPGWTERVYPAGVSPHSCPNYPLCN